MDYLIATGETKNILLGDFVQLPEGVLPVGPIGLYVYPVVTLDDAGTYLEIGLASGTTWLTASQILSVWRMV